MFINRCMFCNTPVEMPSSLCPDCRSVAEREKFDSFAERCPVCSMPLVSLIYRCPRCRDASGDKVFSIYDYRAPFFRHILEKWKFEGRRDLTALIAEEYLLAIRKNYPDPGSIVLVPVPCSPQSLKNRKWDQMADVVRYLKRKHGIKYAFLLENNSSRLREQKTLDRQQRISASGDKYRINTDKSAKADRNSTYVVLDDITTTGSTIHSCTGLLKENGFETGTAITLMAEI